MDNLKFTFIRNIFNQHIMRLCVKIIYLCLFLLSSCEENNSSKEIDSHDKVIFYDTIKRDVPEWFKGDTLVQRRVTELNKMLKLEPLQKGFDSFQLRISIDCDLRDTQHIIVIKNQNGHWNAIFNYYTLSGNEDGSVKLLNHEVEDKQPKSGWESFITRLMATRVEQLPDYLEFGRKYIYPTDSDAVTVEIATSAIYRLYQYPALRSNTDIKEGPGKLEEALLLIEKEFNYKRGCERRVNVSK